MSNDNIYKRYFIFSRTQMQNTINLQKQRGGIAPKFGEVIVNGSPKIYTDIVTSPDNILNDKDLADKINKVLNMLPEEQREVFTLRQQGISFKEIAEMQNCSINTALSRMRYVIIFMRKKLSEMIE